ncbi:helix-turn-helix domain-containing protein [Chitinophaga niabensis]|uniref:Cupin domain-containing protein n=1 Tax=Chitinophaga niabensis TaxID=536979 RepID=A0A1N6EDJ8_9BACT|nr:AraC family transcriptional regulator [Chitinophaga niabensis]SIN81125.1 Cupin domain-containing protein [Chitinophaga niabensis]
MKLLKTEITPLINQSMQVEYREQPFLSSPYHTQPSFHAHPELELVFVVEGFGKRIVGNKVEPFESGDMVFIGSNVPHLWLSDPVYYKENSGLQSKVIVCYFNPKIFMQIFEAIKEFEGIRNMIKQSSKGIRILGETRNLIAQKLIALSNIQGFEKVEGLLQIMHLISSSEEKEYIVHNETDHYDDLYPDRIVDVIKFVKENLHEQITLRQVADVACMTEQSFCRFFKKRTNKSFSRFLSNLRIAHACELLLQTDKQVADVAYLCGYNSSAHFCKVFKEHTGVSPFQYKTSMNFT